MFKTKWILFACLLGLGVNSFIVPVAAQTVINGSNVQVCFLNYTAGWHLLQQCNAKGDFLKWAMLGWEWITGGYFSMIIVSIIIGVLYSKYHDIIYPIYIGLIFLPISYFLFPAVFLSWAIIMAFIGIGILIWWAYMRQTRE